MDKTDIFFWTRHDEYGFLSNFYPASISIGGIIYPTSEHFYQASKTLSKEEQDMIVSLPTAKEAKLAGYHVTLRPDWETIKETVMLWALWTKFSQNLQIKQKLIETGTRSLHEDSPWDKYWGYAQGKGKDRLGILLMQVRKALINQKSPMSSA